MNRELLGAFRPVFVAGHQAAADASVIGVLPLVVENVRVGVEPLDRLRTDRRLFAQPDRRREDENLGRFHLFVDLRPVVALPPLLGHVGIDTAGDRVIDGPQNFDRHSIFLLILSVS